MGSFGGFYKGDKKKPKKDKDVGNSVSVNPSVFVVPELISKKKKDW